VKNLIKKILREDFDWAVDTPSYDDMKIGWEEHVLPYLTGQRPIYDDEGDILDFDRWPEISRQDRESLEPLVKHYFVKQFPDIEFKDGKFLLGVNHWEDFVLMFKDCDYQGSICRHTAEAVLAEGGYWEPYYDVVQDWKGEVWESVDYKTLNNIVSHIKKYLIGDTIEVDGEEFELTEELLTSWLSETETLGHMIDNEVGSGFEDLKNTMRWAYEGAYNDASRDNYWNVAHNAIKEVVGDGNWVSYEGKKRDGSPITRHELEFDVTNIFMEMIQIYFDDYCDLGYDTDCEFEYSSFLDNLIFMMNEEIYGELLDPSVSDWPDSDDITRLFNERLNDEL
jgi:hypothetical protein